LEKKMVASTGLEKKSGKKKSKRENAEKRALLYGSGV